MKLRIWLNDGTEKVETCHRIRFTTDGILCMETEEGPWIMPPTKISRIEWMPEEPPKENPLDRILKAIEQIGKMLELRLPIPPPPEPKPTAMTNVGIMTKMIEHLAKNPFEVPSKRFELELQPDELLRKQQAEAVKRIVKAPPTEGETR